jgi:hypothetical protein
VTGLIDGWLQVPFTGTDMTVVEVQVGDGEWVPAFHDYAPDGTRVAKIRPPADVAYGVPIRSRVAGVVTEHGRYR